MYRLGDDEGRWYGKGWVVDDGDAVRRHGRGYTMGTLQAQRWVDHILKVEQGRWGISRTVR